MKSLTDDLPKPMLALRGKPILEHILNRLRHAGVTEFAIVTGYRADTIESHFAGQAQFFRQDVVNGTARATALAREFIGNDDFLFTFGDILVDSADYAEMNTKLSNDPDALAVAAVRHVDDPWQGAAVYAPDGVVTRIIEKPPPGTSTTNWNSAGIYTFRASVFGDIDRVPLSPRGEYEITSAVESLVARGKVLLHPLTGIWRDIGRPEDLAAAQEEV